MSVVIHEIAHGYAALSYGDHTAEFEGRLTLNPIKHLDLYGSIILPLFLILVQAPFLIGWAKPVPYNPDNFRADKKRIANLWVASAGILVNLAIAFFFGIIIRLSGYFSFVPESIVPLAGVVVLVNIVLAIFNLIPIPPLDGSKILFSLLGNKSFKLQRFLEKYSLVILIVFIIFLWKFVTPVIFILFKFLTGIYF